jgi:osmotically-inducible protein OsmY
MRTRSLASCMLVALGCSGNTAHSAQVESASSTGGSTRSSTAANMRPRPTVVMPSTGSSLAGAPALTGVEESTPQDEGLPTHAEIDLRERVQRALQAEKSLSYTAKHARVEVDEYDVSLYGEVRTSQEKLELGKVVGSVPGVQRVDNRVVVINRTPQANHMSAPPR